MVYWKQRLKELNNYPRVKRLYQRTFIKIYEKKKAEGKTSVDRWTDGEDMFNWWITNKKKDDESPLFS